MNHKLPVTQKLLLPSVFDLIVMSTFTAMILADPMITCFDIFWHLRTGDLLLSGIFPTTDIFSYTAYGKPWILHEWGSQVIFATVYKEMGIAGLIVLKSFVYALMYGLMFRLLLRKNLNIFICLVFTLVLVLGTASGWTVRPHMFTNLFLVMLFWIYTLFREQANQKILWALPVLFLFWINLHGGFIIGFVFLAVIIVAQLLNSFLKTGNDPDDVFSRTKQLIAWSLLSFFACFINPSTYKGVLYPLMYLGNQMDNKLIQEWAAPTMHVNIEFFIFIVLIILGISFQKKKLLLYEILLIMVFTFFVFSAKRHLAVFAIVATPIIAPLWQANIVSLFNTLQNAANETVNKWLCCISQYAATRSEWFGFMEKHLKYHTVLIIAVGTMTAASVILSETFKIGLDNTRYPVDIAEHIKSNNIQGNILNQYGWGGFLLWAVPDKKVFIDGRMDVYKKEISEPYKTLINLEEGWEGLIEKYEIRHILLGREKIMSRFLLNMSDEWVLEKQSDTACFFSRKE